MGEITGPIVGVVLVLLAVFIPTTLISGISGQLYKQFALTIAASTVISGFNSLTLTPAVCALLLRPTPTHKARLFLWFDKMNDWMQRVYDASVKWLLARPVIAIGSYIVISVIAILMFVKWPSTFIPEEDDGYFMIAIQLPAASSLERTQMVGKQIDAILSEYPEVKTYLGVNGFSIMGGGQLPNAATYFVVLKNWKERAGKEHTAQAVVNRFFNGQAYCHDTRKPNGSLAIISSCYSRVWAIQVVLQSSNWRIVSLWVRKNCKRRLRLYWLIIIMSRLSLP